MKEKIPKNSRIAWEIRNLIGLHLLAKLHICEGRDVEFNRGRAAAFLYAARALARGWQLQNKPII